VSGTIEVAELIGHGLGRQPLHVSGVGLRACCTVLCRAHADSSTLERLGLAAVTGAAVLLVGGPDTERALRAWCRACQPGQGESQVRDE
jgi:hypothetical protein